MAMNKNFKMGSLLIAMVLVSMALVPAVSAQEELSNGTKYVDTSDSVSIEKAKEVASFYIKEIPEFIPDLSNWKDATVQLSTTYYDLEGNKSAYSFNFAKNGQYAGYILISATKKNYPLLEFSEGRVPDAVPELVTRSRSLVEGRASKIKLESTDKEELVIGEMKPLYLGLTSYYAEFPLTDTKGRVKDKAIVDLTSSTILDSNQSQTKYSSDETKFLKQQQIREQDANVKWKSIEDKMKMKTIPSRDTVSVNSVNGVSNVPYYSQSGTGNKGCSPTAAAMVLGYWRAKGYSSFPSSSTTLVAELAKAMGTTTQWWILPSGNTWVGNIDGGIYTVCKNHGYSKLKSTSTFFFNDWNTLKAEINAQRPFVLSMLGGGTGSGWTQPYGQHSVTVVGYADGSGEKVMLLHDTWDTHGHSLTFGNWYQLGSVWWDVATWVRPS
jgi:hypothetical protein